MQWHIEETDQKNDGLEDEARSPAPRWAWRLGYGLAIVFVWFSIGLFYIGVGIWAMGDCFELQPCTNLAHQGLADGNEWGGVFVACSFIATALGVRAAPGRRRTAETLVVFSLVVAVLTFYQPASLGVIGFMAIALAPLAVMAVCTLKSSQTWL